MLKELYIDNYKCLTNFTLPLENISLFLGPNGAGKSTVIEVLSRLQRFLAGDERVSSVFPHDSVTRWQTTPLQRFELKIAGESGTYHYQLAIEHEPSRRLCRIQKEHFSLDGKPLFEFENGTARLYRDDFSQGPEYPFDWSQSGLATLQPRADNRLLTRFKEWIAAMIIVRPIPALMGSESGAEERRLSFNGENFASWFRYLSQEHQARIFDLTNELRETLDGFHSFRLIQAGEGVRSLQVGFVQGKKGQEVAYYRYGELSDGQRMLILLYTLLHFIQGEKTFLCIDEPENFLALPEIQPWLTALFDICQEQEGQALLISHHPEIINYLAAGSGFWFEREPKGPSRVQRVAEANETGLTVSELVARGWLHG